MKVRAISGRTATTLEVQGVIEGPIPWSQPGGASGGVIVDLGGVPYVTVDGIRAWAPSFQTITPASGQPVYLSRVRPAVLSLLGMNALLGEGVAVVTFFCPYVCASCATPFERLADLRTDHAAIRAGAPPFHLCPACGGTGAFDDDPTTFFAPVAAQPDLRLTDGVDALIEGKPDVTGAVPLTVELDVEGDVVALWLSGALHKSRPLTRVAPGLRAPLVVIAAEVTGTTSAGLDALRDLLHAVRGEVVLARVTPELAQGLATTLQGTGHGVIASAKLPFHCARCDDVKVLEVPIDAVATTAPLPCPVCRGGLEPRYGDRELIALSGLPRGPVSEGIETYLARHQQPPSVDRAIDWTNILSLPPVTGKSQRDVATVAHNGPAPPAPGPSRPSTVRQKHGFDPDEPSTAQRGAPIVQQAHGRYEIVRPLGQGGMAETLLGRHVGIGGFEKRVVIKRILPSLARDPAFVEMFLHEARTAARINHSNVVQIFDFGRIEDHYYIVMEYVRGWDLSSLMRAASRLNKPFPIEIACRIVAEICAGLTAAHTAVDETGTLNPIIHRDVSPHNILLSTDGAVKLTDFGIAKSAGAADAVVSTNPGAVKGKVAYLAPEVIGGGELSTRIDIYAAGLTLYAALVGRNPYQRKGDAQTMYAVAKEALPNVIKERRDVPFQLAAIIGRAVNRDAGQRFPTAQMFQLHLESFLAEIERQAPSTPMHVALWLTELAREAREHHGGLPLESDSTSGGTPEPGAAEAARPALDDASATQATLRPGSTFDVTTEHKPAREP